MNKSAGRTNRLRAGLLLIVAALFSVISFAQMSPTSPAISPSAAVAPLPASSPAFEVSTVKRNKTGDPGSHSNFQNGRFLASNITLKNLIQYQAYGIPERQIAGGPKWLNSERFDVEAKAGSSVVDQLRTLGRDQRRALSQQLFQQLLADRFKLVAHWETRELPIYSLVAARAKPVLQPAKHPENGFHTSASSGEFTAEGVTLAELANALTQELSSELGRVVVDRTGIQGRYDVSLKWTPERGAASVDSDQDASAPSIFTAMKEQLGLKLESTKGPVPVLVIDRLEMPSEN